MNALLSSQQVDAALIHDLRVELRRLRNGTHTMRPVLRLPAQSEGLTTALKLLGRPRDLDVLAALLKDAAKQALAKRPDKPTEVRTRSQECSACHPRRIPAFFTRLR